MRRERSSTSWCADRSERPAAGAGHRRRQPESRRRRDRPGARRATRGRVAAGRRGHFRVPAAGRECARPRRPRARHLRGCGNRHARRRSSCEASGRLRSSCTPRTRCRPRRCSRPTRRSPAAGPEAWVLCVRGESFELGEGLSAVAALRTVCERGPAASSASIGVAPGGYSSFIARVATVALREAAGVMPRRRVRAARRRWPALPGPSSAGCARPRRGRCGRHVAR